MNKFRSAIIILLSFSVFPSLMVKAQEKEKISPSVTLQYFKNTEDHRILQASLTYSKDRMEIPIHGMEISFFRGGAGKGLMSKVVTDKKGIASFELSRDQKLTTDTKGMWTFSSEFTGNDTIEACTSEITVKDVNLEMTLKDDSIKTISLRAFISVNGKEEAIKGEIVKVYVPRMFSLLPVGDVTLDDSGSGLLEFPTDLPGDKDGNITIISKFEDNPTFGNVEKQTVTRWGKPTDYSKPTVHRALWTTIAPRWMIITLTILLSGVWGHYLYAILSLIRIRINARKKEKEENSQ